MLEPSAIRSGRYAIAVPLMAYHALMLRSATRTGATASPGGWGARFDVTLSLAAAAPAGQARNAVCKSTAGPCGKTVKMTMANLGVWVTIFDGLATV